MIPWNCWNQPSLLSLSPLSSSPLLFPPPPSHIEPDLPTLLNEVAAAIPAKWRQVGGQLKLPAGVLDGLEQQYSRPLDCFEHVLTEWERRRSSPYTWETLIAVLQSRVVGENGLATTLSATWGKLSCCGMEGYLVHTPNRCITMATI